MQSDSDSSVTSLVDPRKLSLRTPSTRTRPSNRSTSPSRTIPSRSAKLKIGSLAEPYTKDGGIRVRVEQDDQGGTGRSRRKRRRNRKAGGGGSGGEEEEKKVFPRDESGRFLPQGGRKRRSKGKGNAKQQDGEEENGEVVDVSLLEDPRQSRFFGQLNILDYTREPGGYRVAEEETIKTVKVGDVVQVLKSRDYAVVEKISVPRDELHRPPTYVPDEIAQPSPNDPEIKSTKRAWVKVSYFYSRAAFEGLERDRDNAFRQQAQTMGPNELVKTDHLDWKPADKIAADAHESIIHCFDDRYPAPSPGNSNGNRATHPLSLYSPDTLAFLSPSEHALPALEPSSSHPPTVLDVHIPPFLFGVGSGLRHEEGRTDRSTLLDGGRDGRKGTPVVRAGFCFEQQEVIKDESENSEEERERKRKRKGKKRQMRTFPLTFNAHSTSRSPYDPRRVQIYSPHSERWYNVDDLIKGKHYRKEGGDEEEEERMNGEAEQDNHKNEKGKKKAEVLDLTDDIQFDAPEREPSPAPSSLSAATASTSSEDCFDDLAGTYGDGSFLPDRLTALWDTTIRRGGANGLTGNAYLVTRAGELLSLLSHSLSSTAAAVTSTSTSSPTAVRLHAPSSASQRANAIAEARALLASARKWDRGVKDRVEGKGEGRKLGREWRETGEGPPGGGAWVCPVTGKEM